MKDKLAEARLAVCEKCEHGEGGGCHLLADWMSVESVAAVTRNKCPDGRWGPGGWLQEDPISFSKDLALCEWRTGHPLIDTGVLIGTDAVEEWLLAWWYDQFRKHNHDVPIAIADFGMTKTGRKWAAGKMLRVPVRAPWSQKSLSSLTGRRACFFRKPLAVLRTPFRRTLWMDLDVRVRGSIAPLFDLPERLALRTEPGWPKKRADWGTARPGEIMYQTGVFVVSHGDPIVPKWARFMVRHQSRKEWPVRCDQGGLSRMCYEENLSPPSIPKKYHNFVHLEPLDNNAICQHYAGPHKDPIRRELGLPAVGVYGGDMVSQQLAHLGCKIIPLRKPDRMPECDVAILWNGLQAGHAEWLAAAKKIGLPVYIGELGLLGRQMAFRQWDREGVNYGASWARDPLETCEGTPVAVGAGDLLLPMQVDTDTQILRYSPRFSSMAEFIRHVAMSSVLPVRVRAHPREKPSKAAVAAVERFPHVRWDHAKGFASSMLDAACVATINSTVGVESIAAGLPVLVYGQACYGHSPAVYVMDGSAEQTQSVTSELTAGRCSLVQEAQEEIIARIASHQIATDQLGEWFAAELGISVPWQSE